MLLGGGFVSEGEVYWSRGYTQYNAYKGRVKGFWSGSYCSGFFRGQEIGSIV